MSALGSRESIPEWKGLVEALISRENADLVEAGLDDEAVSGIPACKIANIVALWLVSDACMC